jgi:hypothetical protein
VWSFRNFAHGGRLWRQAREDINLVLLPSSHILDHPIYNPSPSDLRQPITATDLSVNPSTPHLDEYSISALFKMVAKIINLAMRGLQVSQQHCPISTLARSNMP